MMHNLSKNLMLGRPQAVNKAAFVRKTTTTTTTTAFTRTLRTSTRKESTNISETRPGGGGGGRGRVAGFVRWSSRSNFGTPSVANKMANHGKKKGGRNKMDDIGFFVSLGMMLGALVTASNSDLNNGHRNETKLEGRMDGNDYIHNHQISTSKVLPPPKRVSSSRAKKFIGQAHYDHVIIGAGTAAYTALEVIRQMKPGASVLLISEEQHFARSDVDTEPEHLVESLHDVYNEWRRHIATRLGSESTHHYIGGPANVRKWGTRVACASDNTGGNNSGTAGAEATEPSSVSVLIEDSSQIKINPEDKTITLKDGSVLSYGSCLLAQPGKPRDLYVLRSNISYYLRDKINTLKDIRDFEDLSRVAKEGGKRFLVIGGGYLGTTLCAALVNLNQHLENKNEINQTFVESTVLQQYFPDYLCQRIMSNMKLLGLNILPDRLVTRVQRSGSIKSDSEPEPESEEHSPGATENEDERVALTIMQGAKKQDLECDYVILASTNVKPDVEVALKSGLEIDRRNGGVVCNSGLEVFRDLFVAGSSASFYDRALDTRRRVDFYDNALNTGLLAGQNMVKEDGICHQYNHQPSFQCSLPGMLLEAVGEINSNYTTVGVWLSKRDPKTGKPLKETDFERGIVYYVRDNVVVGILCCNASECMESARDILRVKLNVEDAKKRILLAPSHWVREYRSS